MIYRKNAFTSLEIINDMSQTITLEEAQELALKLPQQAQDDLIQTCQTSKENLFIKNNDHLLNKINYVKSKN